MRISTTALLGALLTTAAAPLWAGTVDAKLLNILLQNGAITKAQHEELSADLQREQAEVPSEPAADPAQFAKQQDVAEINTFAGWAKATKLIGDVRVRHESIDIEGEPSTGASPRDKDRQRVRARIGAISQINPQVETGIQIASGNSADRRGTNQDLDGYFDKKSLWLDLAYIDYHPVEIPGLKVFAGKIKQPWTAVGDIAWDTDINPEGTAVSYQHKEGATSYFGSAGYFVLKDNVDGDGVETEQDLGLYSLQLGTVFDASERTRLTLGGSVYQFNNEAQSLATGALAGNGNTTDKFGLYELFSQLDLIGLALPVSVYGQYVYNADARDFHNPVANQWYYDGGEDTAWLVGLRTNLYGVALDYNYRDVEANAVVGTLTDSDFAAGFTNSSGHKLKAQYDILKNFNIGASYFMAESDAASRTTLDAGVDTLQLDINAKF